MFCLWPMLAMAEIERARDLMSRFKEAMRELWPAARSGNGDAEELIGVMYAMGLGVERDDVRAFEWYPLCDEGTSGGAIRCWVVLRNRPGCQRLILSAPIPGMCCRPLAATTMQRSVRKKLLRR